MLVTTPIGHGGFGNGAGVLTPVPVLAAANVEIAAPGQVAPLDPAAPPVMDAPVFLYIPTLLDPLLPDANLDVHPVLIAPNVLIAPPVPPQVPVAPLVPAHVLVVPPILPHVLVVPHVALQVQPIPPYVSGAVPVPLDIPILLPVPPNVAPNVAVPPQ